MLLGYDLCSAYDTIVPARGKCLVKTDLSIAIPLNTYARIAPRSGLAVKNFIDTGAGVVDYDYRGPVGEFKIKLVCSIVILVGEIFITTLSILFVMRSWQISQVGGH